MDRRGVEGVRALYTGAAEKLEVEGEFGMCIGDEAEEDIVPRRLAIASRSVSSWRVASELRSTSAVLRSLRAAASSEKLARIAWNSVISRESSSRC